MRPTLPAALALAATPALAHHPLEGAPMETFAQGLLSGVGHPLLGFDHLAFVLVAGAAAGVAGAPLRGPLAYVAAMLLGCLATSFALPVPLAEPMIAASLAVTGGLLAFGLAPRAGRMTALLALFGLFHGAAFGGTIAAQEAGAGAPVLLGYLLGLGATQTLIAAAAALAAGRAAAAAAPGAAPLGPRLAGAAVAGIGVFLALEIAEGALL